ncbi:MAG: Hsp20/alpha crystallin family protein [Parcubacteria group bacterium]|nr:Hsp20/alpha crystallin family protein [Parcubacteria group bacterium]
MPIKWRSFKELEKGPNSPHLPNMTEGGEEGWMPFVPTFQQEEPMVDIYQDKGNLYIDISLSGIKPEDVEISIDDNILTIQGKSEDKKEIKEENYLRKEIRKGSFRRVIKLPVDIKDNQAKAESKNGMLKITIPKVSKTISKAKKVPIQIK